MKPTTTLSEESISPLLTEIVTLLNGNQNSILPTVALAVIKEWLARPKTVSELSFTRSTGLLREFMTISGRTVKNPTLLSPLLEAIMEAYFRDAEEDDEDENSGVEALETGSWPELAGIQIFPDEVVGRRQPAGQHPARGRVVTAQQAPVTCRPEQLPETFHKRGAGPSGSS